MVQPNYLSETRKLDNCIKHEPSDNGNNTNPTKTLS